jgi:hypothetical protein
MSRLFVEPKLSIEGLSHCLAWFERQCELSFFQDKEAKLYNNALNKTGNSSPTDIVEAAKMVNAAKRLVQAANELISRMNKQRRWLMLPNDWFKRLMNLSPE